MRFSFLSFGDGLSAVEVANIVGCSTILANVYLKRGEELGYLCKDEISGNAGGNIGGVSYFSNEFDVFVEQMESGGESGRRK